MFDFEKIWNEMAKRKRRAILVDILLSKEKSLSLSLSALRWSKLSFEDQEVIKDWMV